MHNKSAIIAVSYTENVHKEKCTKYRIFLQEEFEGEHILA